MWVGGIDPSKSESPEYNPPVGAFLRREHGRLDRILEGDSVLR